jgi:hypothetical protein
MEAPVPAIRGVQRVDFGDTTARVYGAGAFGLAIRDAMRDWSRPGFADSGFGGGLDDR